MKPAPQSLDDCDPVSSDPPAAVPADGDAPGNDYAQPVLLSRIRSAPPDPIRLDTLATCQQPAAATPSSEAVLDDEVCVSTEAVYTGETLRRAREARGISIEQICERTRITRQHLENVEGDRYDRLPAPVYLRGILMALSKQLRLDGQKVARSYMEASAAAQSAKLR